MADKRKIKLDRLGEFTAKYYGQHEFQHTREGEMLRAPDLGFDAVERFVWHAKNMLKSKDDQIIMITGHERSGKSTLGQHLGRAFKPDLSVDDIIFPRSDIIERIRDAEDDDVIIIDEAGAALMAHEWMEKSSREIVKAFMQFGIKRLKVIIILPHRLLLNKQIRERRIDWWFHCYKKFTPERIERGFTRLRYPERNEWDVIANWKPLMHTHFPKIDDERWREYVRKKKQHVDTKLIEDQMIQLKWKRRTYKGIWMLSNEGKTQEEIANAFDYSRSRVADIISEIKKNPSIIEAE